MEGHAFETYDKFIKSKGGMHSFNNNLLSSDFRVFTESVFVYCPMVVISYTQFVEELKKLPAPEVAVRYYTEGDLYLFGELTFI